MPTVRPRGLTKTGPVRKKRRTASTTTRIRFSAPTARNQQKQILANARLIRRVKATLPSPIWTDYQLRYTAISAASDSDNQASLRINVQPITDFIQWNPIMRESAIAFAQSATQVKRMSMQLTYELNSSYWAQITMFVVTLRKDYASRNPVSGAGPLGLKVGADFIANTDQQNPSLNPAIYRVWFRRNVMLASGSYGQPANTVGNNVFVSNSFSTYRKGSISMKMNMRVRVSEGNDPWREKPFERLPYHQKFYTICFINQGGPASSEMPVLSTVTFDHWNTCMNSG